MSEPMSNGIKPGAIYQMPRGRRVQVSATVDGKVIRNWRGGVAVRNVETGRLTYVNERELMRALSVTGEPAGASESPSEMDSGIVLLVSAASAASGYLERQQPDLAAWLWNAVQLVLNSQSAPVSPVEPTPGCGCDLCRAPQGSAILTTIHAPTGAPAPCVWREDGPTMATGCGVRNSMLPHNPIKQGWKVCPYCTAPLTARRTGMCRG